MQKEEKTDKQTTGSRLRILVAHRYALFSQALAALLEQANFEVVGVAIDLATLSKLTKEQQPNLLLLDAKIEGADVSALRSLSSLAQGAGVAVLLDPESIEDFFPSMGAGVSGYLSKTLDREKLADSLRLMAKGEVVISREMAISLAEASTRTGPTHEPLTEREVQVLGMVGTGATNKEIAEQLIITENTVKVHLRNILDKLHLRNRQQAAAYAAQQGIKAEVLLDEDQRISSGSRL